MTVNCDIGERGHDHPVDTALMGLIGIANIACGGHAGDAESVQAFRAMAHENGVEVAAHLSYPDKENFGRKSMDLPSEALLDSLDEQYALMADVKTVKFHGALYNDCARDTALAHLLAEWLDKKGIRSIITPGDSEMALASRERKLTVVSEAFAERRYAYDPSSARLSLVPRDRDYASIYELEAAVAHAREIAFEGTVTGHIDRNGIVETLKVPLEAQTMCIHSDSEISLELARALKEILA